MGCCFIQEHDRWIKIAKDDLRAAKVLVPLELLSASVYHSQQSAEKMLKAYLVFKNYQVVKTHDLIKLLELCMSFDQEFRKKFEDADFINPFSFKFRYPTEFEIPSLNDATSAIKHAESIMRFVLKKIAEPSSDQKNIFDGDL